MWVRSFIGLVILSLAACGGQTKIYNTELSPSYRPTEYGYGAGRRDFKTVVQGNPFQMPEQQFLDDFIALLNRNQPFLQPTNFTLTPGPDARLLYRVVYLFNTAPSIPDRLCRQPLRQPTVDLGDTVRVTAAFCRRQGFLSTTTGEVDVDSIDDPRFERLIGQINLLLFPPVDPSRRDRGGRWFFVTDLESDSGLSPGSGHFGG
ncbi:MAG: hypothetical protein AAF637_02235 [Pseudomonadota bacterium]